MCNPRKGGGGAAKRMSATNAKPEPAAAPAPVVKHEAPHAAKQERNYLAIEEENKKKKQEEEEVRETMNESEHRNQYSRICLLFTKRRRRQHFECPKLLERFWRLAPLTFVRELTTLT